MSVLSYGTFPSQPDAGNVRPSKGVSQFKAPLRRKIEVQSGKPPEQGQRYFTPGSPSSRGVSQFRTPFRREIRVPSGKLQAQDRPYSASFAPPFNGAPLLQVTHPSQPVVRQTEKQMAQRGYHAPSRMQLSNAAFQRSGTVVSLPRVLALPSVVARDTYAAGDKITGKSGVLTIYPNEVSTDPYVGIPAPLSPLEALRQRPSSQFLRESARSWHPQSEARVRPEARHRTKTHVTMKVIFMGGTALLMGGIASFLLLRFPTYLVVIWAILIIIFSNLVSRELRSYYRLKPTALRREVVHPSTISTSQGEDTGCHSVLNDISDTTGYLKALCLAFKNEHPAQAFPLVQNHAAFSTMARGDS